MTTAAVMGQGNNSVLQSPRLREQGTLFRVLKDANRTETTSKTAIDFNLRSWCSPDLFRRLCEWNVTPRIAEATEVAVGPAKIDRETQTSLSLVSRLAAALQVRLQTKIALQYAEACSSPVAAYKRMQEMLSSEWSPYALATYLEDSTNQFRHIMLGLIADESVVLPKDLQHCVIGLLHSSDRRLSNCSCLALLAGGNNSEKLLRDAVEKHSLEEVRRFLESYSDSF